MSDPQKVEPGGAAEASNKKENYSEGPPPKWMRFVPLLTGVLAGLAGYLAVRGSNLSNEAIYHSNQGVLFQAQASDMWAEYQADSIKSNIVDVQLDAGTFVPDAKGKLEETSKKFKDRKPATMAAAKELEGKRDSELKGALQRLEEKDSLSIAGVAIQLGIALASVAGLTRRREAFIAGLVAGGLGAGITAYVLIHHFLAAKGG